MSKVKSKNNTEKGCGREEHFTFMFIGFSVGIVLITVAAALVQSSREDDAKAARINEQAQHAECEQIADDVRRLEHLDNQVFEIKDEDIMSLQHKIHILFIMEIDERRKKFDNLQCLEKHLVSIQ